jgi:hypothetical protein
VNDLHRRIAHLEEILSSQAAKQGQERYDYQKQYQDYDYKLSHMPENLLATFNKGQGSK